jgi:hypothetical protein
LPIDRFDTTIRELVVILEEHTMLTIPGLLIILAFVFAVLSLMGRMAVAVPVFVLALERLYSVLMIGLIR